MSSCPIPSTPRWPTGSWHSVCRPSRSARTATSAARCSVSRVCSGRRSGSTGSSGGIASTSSSSPWSSSGRGRSRPCSASAVVGVCSASMTRRCTPGTSRGSNTSCVVPSAELRTARSCSPSRSPLRSRRVVNSARAVSIKPSTPRTRSTRTVPWSGRRTGRVFRSSDASVGCRRTRGSVSGWERSPNYDVAGPGSDCGSSGPGPTTLSTSSDTRTTSSRTAGSVRRRSHRWSAGSTSPCCPTPRPVSPVCSPTRWRSGCPPS